MQNIWLFLSVIFLSACSTSKMIPISKTIDAQGHRGCRGVLPENTIIAFEKALEDGVSTLEMDLAITQDGKVLVSHEPFFNHEISIGPNGEEITKDNQTSHNIYQMNADQAMTYDVGSKPHPRFPDQKKIVAHKPLLLEVISMAEKKSSEMGRPVPYYNIEIKRHPSYDHIFHPPAEEFAKIIVEEVQSSGIKDRIYIQSFDITSLQACKKLDPDIKLVLLIENEASMEENVQRLGFTPDVYSPYFKLVDASLINRCHRKQIKVIPWTVNESKDMDHMLNLGVDGIISDFPALLINRILARPGYSIL